MKALIKKFLRSRGFELVRYTPKQQENLEHNPSLSYRDLVIEEAMVLSGGEVNLSEQRFLAELIRSLQNSGPIVEIGTLFGTSTQVILLEKPVTQELISVDAYCWNPLNISPEHHYRITKQILDEAADTLNLKQINTNKNEFYKSYSGPSPALVFCDAIHTYEETKLDIEWAQKVNATVICGHDYHHEKFPDVVKVVDEFGGPQKVVDTLWVL